MRLPSIEVARAFVLALALLAACTSTSRTEPANDSLSIVTQIASLDKTLAPRLAPNDAGWSRDDNARIVSPGWRDAALYARREIAATLADHADEAFAMGLGRSASMQATFTPIAMMHAAATIDRGRVIYKDAAPSTDVIFAATASTSEWLYLLRDDRAPHAFALNMTIPAALPKVSIDHGALVFADTNNHEQMRMPAPIAFDARGAKVPAFLAWNDGAIAVSIDAKNARYPILVDPSLTTPVWLLRQQDIPPGRIGPMTAYDSKRDRVVMNGGDGWTLNQDTWEWDGSQWYLVSTIGPSRTGVAAFDPVRNLTLVFDNDTGFTSTWDGTVWTQVTTGGPAPRNSPAMAYDSGRGLIVLTGGNPNQRVSDAVPEEWDWDGTSWTLSPQAFPARFGHGMSYDSDRQRLVAFGGQDANGNILGDTLERTAAGWVTVSTIGPSERIPTGMAYVNAIKKTVLFGGEGPGYATYSDTWEWDGTTWTQVATNGPGRWAGAFTYDSTRNRVVLFGGGIGLYYLGDTWEWDTTTWVFRAGPIPPARRANAMTYDSKLGRSVMIGGVNASGIEFADSWLWDGTTWTEAADMPFGTRDTGLAYDSNRDRVVCFAGAITQIIPEGFATLNTTIPIDSMAEWDGTTWTALTPSPIPSARFDHSLVFDAAQGKTLLFGGVDGDNNFNSETWTWDGTTWVMLAPALAPEPRSGHAMAYDSARQRVVLYGGAAYTTTFDDTWEWDGTNWAIRLSHGPPGPRTQHAMVFDSARNVTVLEGGDGSNDIWEWDGNNWNAGAPAQVTSATVSLVPGPTKAAAFDQQRGRTVFFARVDTLDDHTWEYWMQGGLCTSGATCDSGYCVDGECCASFCGACQKCNDVTNPGVCTSIVNGIDPDSCVGAVSCGPTGLCGASTGTTCTKSTDCNTGFCVDGVCCGVACDDDCQACSVASGSPANGTCALSPRGSAGKGACGAYACSGRSVDCSTQCADDIDCASGDYCSVDGQCVAQKSLGASCSEVAGADCLVAGCRVCPQGFCEDGVCCNTACSGACDNCNTTAGTCTFTAEGLPGSPSCEPGVCAGDSASCGTKCSSTADCAAGAYCDTANGVCLENRPLGSACTSASLCASGFCVDGTCCDSACDGVCEACDMGGTGGCVPIAGKPHGTREPCPASKTSNACEGRACDGVDRTSCDALAGGETVCVSESCTGGIHVSAGYCDGKGGCAAADGGADTKACAPYACGVTTCNTSCASNTDCASDATCDPSLHTCTAHAVCAADGTLVSPSGSGTNCSPYVCKDGACPTSCVSIQDCISGFICTQSNECAAAPEAQSTSGCGCRIAGDARSNGASAWVALGIAAMLTRPRKRRRRDQL